MSETTYSVSKKNVSTDPDLIISETSTTLERGDLAEYNSTTIKLTKTYQLEGTSLVYIPLSFQTARTVSWNLSGTRITLDDSVYSSLTDGTFTKQ